MGAQMQPGGFQYLGCFVDNVGTRDLPIATTALTSADRETSLTDCAGQCAGYEYMGLQWTSECFCGNSYGIYGSGECPDDCGLSSGTSCSLLNAIYNVQPDRIGKFFLPPSLRPSLCALYCM
jgi:hypothetical protein